MRMTALSAPLPGADSHGEVHAGVVLENVYDEVVDDGVLVEIDWVLDLEARAELLKEPPNMCPRTPYEENITVRALSQDW